MSATNHTTNYSLSQFIGTDKPAWLVDYNNDMSAIDAQMKQNADDASAANTLAGTADGKADANALAIQTLDNQINTPGTGLAADVAANALAIQGVNNTVGNTPLDTTAQTCTGAINELDNEINGTGNIIDRLDILETNKYGTPIDISSYNSAANKYILPSDGYIALNSATESSGHATIVLYDSTESSAVSGSLNASAPYEGYVIYAKKGMRTFIDSLPSGFTATFLPFTV